MSIAIAISIYLSIYICIYIYMTCLMCMHIVCRGMYATCDLVGVHAQCIVSSCTPKGSNPAMGRLQEEVRWWDDVHQLAVQAKPSGRGYLVNLENPRLEDPHTHLYVPMHLHSSHFKTASGSHTHTHTNYIMYIQVLSIYPHSQYICLLMYIPSSVDYTPLPTHTQTHTHTHTPIAQCTHMFVALTNTHRTYVH